MDLCHIEKWIKDQKKERLNAKRNMLLPNKTKVQVDLEERELKIARALQASIKSVGGGCMGENEAMARTIVEHAGKRMSTPGGENRLIETWEEVEKQLDAEILKYNEKTNQYTERKYQLLKQRQKKMFDVRMNAVVDRHQREVRQEQRLESVSNVQAERLADRRRREGTRNTKTAKKHNSDVGSFQHLSKESRRVWGKFRVL
jgi:hypothetical protein